jgi:outer membrane protein OmpA-like peptidoglycan-associated protein
MHIGKSLFLIVISILFCITHSNAQYTFTGRVLEDSTDKTPVYQATVAVTENNQPIGSVSTYFDGAFAIGVKAGKSYTLKISSPGLKDRQISFLTDKKGHADIAPPTLILIKDGLRLVGRVIDDKTNLPISRATVILKDVQTRTETYSTSGSDGMYNLKLNFETNYRVFVDKRSPGIFNQYEDTSFFISTVGFTLPLDYRLDIRLEKAEKLLPSYGDYEDPAQKTIKAKPIIDVKAINDSLQKLRLTTDNLQQTAPTIKLKEPTAKDQKPEVSLDDAIAPPKTDKKEIKTAGIKLRAERDSIEKETKKAAVLRAKQISDSLTLVKQTQDSINKAKPTTIRKKEAKKIAQAAADSLQKLQVQAELKRKTAAADSLARVKRINDSILLARKAEQKSKDSIAKAASDYELKLKQAKNDSIINSKFTSAKAAGKPAPVPTPVPAAKANNFDSIKVTRAQPEKSRNDTTTATIKQNSTAASTEKKTVQAANQIKDDSAISKTSAATTQANATPSAPAPKNKSLGIVYFVKNNSGVTTFSKAKLKTIADQLKAGNNYTLSLESYAGYEENKPIELSDERAASVKQALVQLGLDASRITIQANGFSKPFNDCHTTKDCTEQKLILNRRVELILK